MRWYYPSSAISSVAPVQDPDAIYLPLIGGEIVSLRPEDGQLVWKTDVGGDVLLTPTADAERLYVASEARGAGGESKEPAFFLRSVSRSSGVVLWFRPLPRAVQHAFDSRASTLFAATLGDIVIGVEKSAGTFKWSSHLPAPIAAPPILNGGRLYLALESGEIIILKLEDGQTLGRYRTQGRITAFSSAGDGALYWATSEGYVNASAETEGALTLNWRRRVGAEIQSLSQTQDGLLVVARDNSVTYLNRQNGRRVWKRRLPDRLAAQPVLHAGAGLFAPLGEDVCIVLSLRDGKQVNTLYLGANNSVVAPPVIAEDYLLIPTKLGLLAFTASR
jgi:outer membrane protein assembly factor BamB